jgi:hypothetical protein
MKNLKLLKTPSLKTKLAKPLLKNVKKLKRLLVMKLLSFKYG